MLKDYVLAVLMLPSDTPIILVPVLGLIILFIYFAAAIEIRKAAVKRFGKNSLITKAIVYTVGGRFLWQDVVANYVCFAPLVLSWPNRHKEGRTITSHINNILERNILDIQRGTLSGFNKWRVTFCLFLGKQLNKVDPDHISVLS